MANPLEQACRDAGLPLGRQRLVIVAVLGGADDHPTAVEIHRRARASDPRISLATVYRTLGILEQRGLVRSLVNGFELGGRRARFEDAARGAHDHIIDADTGAIENFKDEALEQALREFVRKKGYHLRDYRLDLLCSQTELSGRTATAPRRVARAQ